MSRGGPRPREAVPGDRDALADFARAMARETEDRTVDSETLRTATSGSPFFRPYRSDRSSWRAASAVSGYSSKE
jgi:hypothetical protein